LCHLAASFNPERLKHLVSLGLSRGNKTHSIAQFKNTTSYEDSGVKNAVTRALQIKTTAPIDLKSDMVAGAFADESLFKLIHTQAPTGNVTASGVHPAITQYGTSLWHNGIIREIRGVQDLRTKWDTEELCKKLTFSGFTALDGVVGSFACFYYDQHNKTLFVFRNEAAPLYYNPNTLDFCSIKFENSREFQPGVVHSIIPDAAEPCLRLTTKFKLAESPFFFAN